MNGNIDFTKEEYEQLLADARDGNALKKLITERANSYNGLSYTELKLLKELYSLPDESEDAE